MSDTSMVNLLTDEFGDEQAIDPRLFAKINWEKEVPEDLRLLPDSMAEWDKLFGKENLLTAKKQRTEESIEPFKLLNRFGICGKPASEEEMQTVAKGFVPSTTKASTSWDVHNFRTWRLW